MTEFICALLLVYLAVVFIRIVLSWFPTEPGSSIASLHRVLYDLTEPVLAPVRGLLPTVGGGGMAIDLSPIIVILGLTIIRGVLCG